MWYNDTSLERSKKATELGPSEYHRVALFRILAGFRTLAPNVGLSFSTLPFPFAPKLMMLFDLLCPLVQGASPIKGRELG